ncbi:MAG: Ig-like domain-containing protein [Mycoplasmoidaceae bacterium]|nr:Ig-like domain-containing protein [Mycoplasmoidaceae bacterium]
MKKKLLIPILLTTASLPLVAITSCNKQIHPTNITLNKTSLSLEQGTTFELKATLEPESVAYQLEWSSTSRDVATVNNGVITAKQPGLTTITVKVVGFADVQTTCTVRVVEPLKCFTVTALENSTLVTYGNGPYSYPSNLSYSTDGIV